MGIELAATIPWDEQLPEYDLKLKSLLDLPDSSKAVAAIDKLIAGLLN